MSAETKDQYFQLIEATWMLLNDRPKQPVDAALLIGRSYFDADKKGIYQLLKEFYENHMATYIALYGNEGQRFGDLTPNIAAPRRALARDRLVKLGIPNDNVIDSELEDPLQNNTFSEGKAFINLAEERGWRRIVAVTNPHQIVRVMLGLVKIVNTQETPIDIYAAVPNTTHWNKKVRGSQGQLLMPRYQHIGEEISRIFIYQAKGDLATFDELFEYLRRRGE